MTTSRELLQKAMAPRSDQLNADDLVAADRTITISAVKVTASPEQPVWIHYHGDNGKPWKPSKGMMRVLAHAWGEDPDQWVGRSVTLYADPNVKFGGQNVGGIRISHMSHIDKPMKMLVTVARSKRVEYSVGVLQAQQQPASGTGANNAKVIAQQLKNAAHEGTQSLDAVWAGVPAHEKTQQMIDWYNQQCASARQVDAQRAQDSDHGFVPPEAEDRQAAPQQQDSGPVEQAGIGDI